MNVAKLEKKWRHPRGKHAKIRLSRNGHGLIPKVGYGSKQNEKGLIGRLKPVILHSSKDLEDFDTNNCIGLISNSVGLRNKVDIVKKAEENRIKLLNIKDPKAFLKEVEEMKEAKKKEKSKRETEKKDEEKTEKKAEKKSIDDSVEKEKEEKRKILEKGL